MKLTIIFITNFITLVGIYFIFVLLFMPSSNYYYSKAFESLFWISPIILPLLIIIFIVDSLYCNKTKKGWLIKETLIVILMITFFSITKHSFQLFYIFAGMWLVTQIIKYFIFSKYCSNVQEKD